MIISRGKFSCQKILFAPAFICVNLFTASGALANTMAYNNSFAADNSKSTTETYFLLNNSATQNLPNIVVPVLGGGVGGNKKNNAQAIIYGKDLPALHISRNDRNQTCYLMNPNVLVYRFTSYTTGPELVSFTCINPDENKIYWNTRKDEINGGYSPPNDALYAAEVIINMYKSWYNLPLVLTSDGKPAPLRIITNWPFTPFDGWDGLNTVYIGNGDGNLFYPFTSIKSIAYVTAQLFSGQNSGLTTYTGTKESQAVAGAFGDLAEQAAEYYTTGKTSWLVGNEIMSKDIAMRYMDQPSKDCYGQPRDKHHLCSFDNENDWYEFESQNPDVDIPFQFLNGIFDHAFYLLANTNGWDVKKTFEIVIQANQYYWHATDGFFKAACGVMWSAEDHSNSAKDVIKTFATVGIAIDESVCRDLRKKK